MPGEFDAAIVEHPDLGWLIGAFRVVKPDHGQIQDLLAGHAVYRGYQFQPRAGPSASADDAPASNAVAGRGFMLIPGPYYIAESSDELPPLDDRGHQHTPLNLPKDIDALMFVLNAADLLSRRM